MGLVVLSVWVLWFGPELVVAVVSASSVSLADVIVASGASGVDAVGLRGW